MKKNKDYIFYGVIIIFVILFLASALVFKVYNVEILPSQFYGALIGVFITTIITAFLLRGQTEGDEKREKSLKVFETQKEKYNNFIDEIWKIWDSRFVRLEEVNELLMMVSKDIVLYTKPQTVNKILENLTKIAEYANSENANNIDNFSKEMQKPFFDIIDCLAKEINLGGEINDEFRNNLNALESKLLPHINSKKYVKILDELVRSKIKVLQKFEYVPDTTSKERNVCRWLIDKDMWLRVGDQSENGRIYLTFWSDFYENRQYQHYRLQQRGEDKDWLQNYEEDISTKIGFNFNDFREGKTLPPDALENLAKHIEEFFNKEYETFGNKDIIGLIEECNQ